MTLSFSQSLNGKPTYFMEKISKSVKNVLFESNPPIHFDKKFIHPEINLVQLASANKKIHTIRADKTDRWKVGTKIHFVINNRTKNRFQFAPLVKCKGVEKIRFEWFNRSANDENNPFLWSVKNRSVRIFINERKLLDANEICHLAINDGFDTVEEFFNYFNFDFQGKIIHWTSYSYCC